MAIVKNASGDVVSRLDEDGWFVADSDDGMEFQSWLHSGVPSIVGSIQGDTCVDEPSVVQMSAPTFWLAVSDHCERIGWSVEAVKKKVAEAFCPTGIGGGRDNSCAPKKNYYSKFGPKTQLEFPSDWHPSWKTNVAPEYPDEIDDEPEVKKTGGVHDSMARLRAKHPQVAALYRKHSHTSRGSIGKHTGEVADEWPNQISQGELNGISQRWGGDVSRLMNDAIALHDIGKGEAIAAGKKSNQHKFTIPIMQDVLSKEGYSQRDIDLAVAIVGHDQIGKLAQGMALFQDVTKALANSSEQVGMNHRDFVALQKAYYFADAGSYPNIVSSQMVRDETGKLKMKRNSVQATLDAL